MKIFLVCAIACLAAGCGYHISGNSNLMPKTIHVVAVPEFANNTPRSRLGHLITADTTREFISRTRYTLVSDANQADAVLKGTVLTANAYPIIVDPTSGRATAVQVIVTMAFNLTDRHTGKTIYNRPNYEFRERYEITLDPQQYFDETGTAIERLSKDVGRSVVSAILENF